MRLPRSMLESATRAALKPARAYGDGGGGDLCLYPFWRNTGCAFTGEEPG